MAIVYIDYIIQRPAADSLNLDTDKSKNLKRPYSRLEKHGSVSALSDDSNSRVKALPQRGTATFDAGDSTALHASGSKSNDAVAGPSRRRNDDDSSRPRKFQKTHSQGFQVSFSNCVLIRALKFYRDETRRRKDFQTDQECLTADPSHPMFVNPVFIDFCTEVSDCQTPASIHTPAHVYTNADHAFKATSEHALGVKVDAPSQQKLNVGEKIKVEEQVVDDFLNNLVGFLPRFWIKCSLWNVPRRTCIRMHQKKKKI